MEEVVFYPFDVEHEVPARDLAHLLGGKGAGLAEMTAMGIAVPPGFTIPLTQFRRYREAGWDESMDKQLCLHVERLGDRMGRHFGDESDPLLVAVRSGAPVSMPGMLDTVLNLGLNDRTVLGLARVSGDESFAWDSYRRFLHMFGTSVLGVPAERLEFDRASDSPEELRQACQELRARIRSHAERDVPTDPFDQLREAIGAVFASWDSPRARAYRSTEGIDEDMGTAVNVQAMVFGNRGGCSGTGVVFTRNPSTGGPGLYGDYLPRAQGEDVVAGSAHTMPIGYLAEHLPETYRELTQTLRRLECHYRDICDVEFTIENGRLWLLQTRVAKRGAVAAVRAAVELAGDEQIALSRAEAVARVPAELRERARREVLAREAERSVDSACFAVGLGASPGRVSGRIVLSSEAAADADGDVILVRPQTSPEDVAGMAASVGILTTSGGLVSHAAVVARGWGIPAVVGAKSLVIDGEVVRSEGGTELREGDLLTIDGSTGEVWAGPAPGAADGGETSGSGASGADGGTSEEEVLRACLPELLVLEEWAAQLERR